VKRTQSQESLRDPSGWVSGAFAALHPEIRSPWAVAVTVLLFYGTWLAFAVPQSHGGRDFVLLGESYAQRAPLGSVLHMGPPYLNKLGYDGEFYYFIALDPLHARVSIDDPPYRYTRILYPLVSRLLALGQPHLIPYTLILVNWLALAGGTLALAAFLRRKRASPWFALVYGLYPGLAVSLQRDLTEPLSYGLVAVAIYLFDRGGRWRLIGAGGSFALAILAREVAAVFGVIYAVSLLLERPSSTLGLTHRGGNARRAGFLLVLALGPLALYKAALAQWLGSSGVPSAVVPVAIPFGGLLAYWPWRAGVFEQIVWVTIPALVPLLIAVRAWRGGFRSVEAVALVVNVVLFAILLNITT